MISLKPGDKAPYFEGIDQDEKPVSLKDYKGKKFIIYFYPKDDTPGCTKEACSLRDNYRKFEKMGYSILGVSPDKAKKHRSFIEKYELQFPLLADTEKETIMAFGAWGLKKFMGREFEGVLRSTFIINEEGIIENVIEKVRTKDHGDQVLELVAEEKSV
jgi:peroxiredoxin Q/BCP